MKRVITLFGIAVMAMFAFTAIPIATASAELTKILVEPTTGEPLTDEGEQPAEGRLLTVGGNEIKCKKGKGGESFTSANNGTGKVEFEKCTSALSTKCKSTGAAAETIATSEVEVHFWLALLMLPGNESTLVGALVFLLKEIPIVCENATKTIKLELVVQNKSCIAADVLPTSMNGLVSSVHEEFTEWEPGETHILSVLPAGGTSEIPCLPTVKAGAGTAELFAISALLLFFNFRRGGSAITIELMNP